MSTKPEQVDPRSGARCKRYLKRQTAKWRRRLAKKLVGDTPKEHYKGYS